MSSNADTPDQTSDSMFLTRNEIKSLVQSNNKKSIAKWLEQNQYAFATNADGWPVVLISHLDFMQKSSAGISNDNGEKQRCGEATVLYRHFNGDGELLYVGISKSVMCRIFQHKDNSSWFREIENITLEHFESRYLAENAEILAIRAEKPKHNKQYTN